MMTYTQSRRRKAVGAVAHKARVGRRASVMKPEYLAEIEQYRLMEDDIVAKHLENALRKAKKRGTREHND